MNLSNTSIRMVNTCYEPSAVWKYITRGSVYRSSLITKQKTPKIMMWVRILSTAPHIQTKAPYAILDFGCDQDVTSKPSSILGTTCWSRADFIPSNNSQYIWHQKLALDYPRIICSTVLFHIPYQDAWSQIVAHMLLPQSTQAQCWKWCAENDGCYLSLETWPKHASLYLNHYYRPLKPRHRWQPGGINQPHRCNLSQTIISKACFKP